MPSATPLTYQGACHCGRVRFELDAKLDYVMVCSCSLCRRVGALWHGASDASLRITAGESELTLYQFNTMTARHYACKHCGVHPFSRPRLDPGRWAVNVRCIDDVDLSALPLKHFDGANWEQAAEALRTRAANSMRPAMSDHPITLWHRIVRARDVQGLDALLADDAVFHSPVVHTPQVGKAITSKYLAAAFHVFFNESFRYVRELSGDRDAMLEFEVQIDGIRVNGVDLIRWNDAGQVVEFKVMLRPLKAVNLIHQKMAAMLAAPSPSP